MAEERTRVCGAVSCAFRGIEVRTALETCLGCGGELGVATIGYADLMSRFDGLFRS